MFPKGLFDCYHPPDPVVPVGTKCSGFADDCGGDPSLCCGIAKEGGLVGSSSVKL
jgi:hypothetical protein